ncbi:START-like domain-containing protein [Flammeovirga kamogawensis]|uniref:START-like domain-containing protein n=1 Tax=Flammeovirga kamogawensis TaxID=373891 RepID=A0ABX8GWB9_9BACT|nr:START-like domain-containing protein [Flammeovirga kamogawensis]MBB6460543.1 uncharacterized protein YndB with AHSA1/START domain [Flammeovirga kamogawensis]QWG07905.1 hypothetical protein KM029_02935 [Flammeovirga kamogawensis]TRX69711.1 hypothetical protein EO216_16865 [Flammeovirga kamogawensis]
MERYKYQAEFEFRVPLHKLYPYFVMPNLLKDWFADNVKEDIQNKEIVFTWGNDVKKGKVSIRRQNQRVKYTFDKEDNLKSAYVDFKFEFSELAQSSFLQVTDYSDMDDEDELKELWEEMFGRLHEIIGG